jgi:hypothetical protein
LGRAGENRAAPIAALYLLEHGDVNRIEPIGAGAAAQRLLRNILFFADGAPAAAVFSTACDFLEVAPAFKLVFRPESEVWELVA